MPLSNIHSNYLSIFVVVVRLAWYVLQAVCFTEVLCSSLGFRVMTYGSSGCPHEQLHEWGQHLGEIGSQETCSD